VVVVSGLQGAVEIARDQRGVPWIAADVEHDLYLGMGVAMAYDRLWQMDVLRRRAAGRLAEVFGRRAVGSDVLARTLAFERLARDSAVLLPASAHANIAAFARGVDIAVRRLRRRGQLPLEFHVLRHSPAPWTVSDSLAIIKQLGFHLGRNAQQEIFRSRLLAERPDLARSFLTPKYPPGGSVSIDTGVRVPQPPVDIQDHPAPLSAPTAAQLAALLAGRQWSGSNAWAISAARSATGFAALANDPHISFSQPSLWYQMGLELDGERAYGVTVPGLPGLVIGANSSLAWGMTNSAIDTQDLAVGAPTQCSGKWSETSTVRVRGAADITVTASGGPGYARLQGQRGEPTEAVALYWSGFHPSVEAESCQRMWRAQDYAAFRASLRGFGVPVVNFTVATRSGVVALRTAGLVPRRNPRDSLVPADVDVVASRWHAPLSFDELPELIDPPSGSVVSANHQILPVGVAPHLGVDWGGPYRADRIGQLLTMSALVDPEDFGAWQLDLHNGRAQRILPTLLEALEQRPPASPLEAFATNALYSWNGKDAADLAAPLVFGELLNVLTERWVTSRLGDDIVESMTDLTLQVDHLVLNRHARRQLGESEKLPAILAKAMAEVTRRLTLKFGDDPSRWRYGHQNRIADPHILAGSSEALRSLYRSPSTPVGGGGQSVCLMYPDRTGRVVEGAPWRFIAEFGPNGSTRIRDVLRHGSSGHPLSSHYDDQTQAHAEGGFYEVFLERPQKNGHSLRLVPDQKRRRSTHRLRPRT
jgi:penicillin amidase